MNRTVAVIACLFVLSGCSTVEKSMAGRIGCPEDDIQILSSNPGWGFAPTTWIARCRGQKFVCSSRPKSESDSSLEDMHCTQMIESFGGGDYEMGDARAQTFEEFIENPRGPAEKPKSRKRRY